MTCDTLGMDPCDRILGLTSPVDVQVMFNQSLVNVTLPPQLQSLTFGQDFNQNLEGVKLPSSLSLQRLRCWVISPFQLLLDPKNLVKETRFTVDQVCQKTSHSRPFVKSRRFWPICLKT